MKYLVTSPPVISPSEPPSGAFLLSAGLAARGVDAGFLDLSLEFFKYVFDRLPGGRGHPDADGALEYLRGNMLYTPHGHRTASGVLNSAMKHFSKSWPGWKLTLMDVIPPVSVHRPEELADSSQGTETPFSAFWEEYLLPLLELCRPESVLVSLSYLSQLPAGIDLVLFLRSRGYSALVGGSLLNSLSRTGSGLRLVKNVLHETVTGDGSFFPGFSSGSEPLLAKLAWPVVVGKWDYISGRPVIPFALSTGCYWDRCLFCPDSGREHRVYGRNALEGLLESMPSELMARKPVIHFLDSAIPWKPLEETLPVITASGLGFYTFARPEQWLPEAAEALAGKGCLMLQLGVESGSPSLLQRYRKGISPSASLESIRRCAGAGIRTYVYMLLGLPGETLEDISASAGLLEDAGDSMDFVNFSVFNLPENCELVEKAAEFGIRLLEPEPSEKDSMRLYRPFLHEGSNTRPAARRNINAKLATIPSVRRAMMRTPRWFRASHFPLLDIPGRKTGL